MNKYLNLILNYIYIYHLSEDGEFVVMPQFPDSISDNMSVNYAPSNPIARTAPMFSWTQSGPRTVSFSFELHKEMFDAININVSNMKINEGEERYYVDALIKKLQACALPRYADATKMINPPMVAVKIGEEIFIKGVINGQVGVTYSKPILPDNTYAVVKIDFTVNEVDPYDAETVAKEGSFRGITKTLKEGIFR